MNIYKNLTVATVGLTVSFTALEAHCVQAATITYDFTVEVTSGLLAGEIYKGFFSYDDSTLAGNGVESVAVGEGLSISFNFLDVSYAETDDNTFEFGFPFVEFNNGTLVGLQYTVVKDSIFSIFGDEPNGLGGGDKFNYIDKVSFEVGDGSVVYSLRQPSTSVPEPSVVLALGVLSLGSLMNKTRVQRHSSRS